MFTFFQTTQNTVQRTSGGKFVQTIVETQIYEASENNFHLLYLTGYFYTV